MDSVLRNIPINGFRICVDERNTDVSGRAYSPLLEEGIAFTGFNELLLKLDKIFDAAGYPEAFQEKRTFGQSKETEKAFDGMPSPVVSEAEIKTHTGHIETFDVVVNARRNTSWQGIVYNGQGQMLRLFDSEMELLAEVLHANI